LIVVERESKTKKVAPLEPLQTEPRLGGEGSGQPPPYYVATGQASHAVVGIDLGTRYTRIAMVHEGRPVLIKPDIFPSLVQITTAGPRALGRPGPLEESETLISSVKPKIGSEWRFEWGNVSYCPEDFATVLFTALKHAAQDRLERDISKVVLTVPTSFTSAQRKLFKEAAEAADLEVLQLINEPTAVALTHGYFFPELEGNFLVYSLGAGVFAASVLSISNGIIEIKSASGNSALGADNFDDQLLKWMIEEFERQNQMPFAYNGEAIARLRAAAERARIDLTIAQTAHIKVTNLPCKGEEREQSASQHHLIASIDRETFAQLSANLLEETMRHVETAMRESHFEPDEINCLILAGPPTNMSVIKDRVSNIIKNNRLKIVHSGDGWPALGAAVQASLVSNDLRDYVTWDVLSVPVGIELPGGKFKKLIDRGTPLPVTAYHAFASPDGTINACVVQGESECAQENMALADLTINNCPPTAAQETKVEVAFCVRQDGIVHYSARHIGLGVNLTVGVRHGDKAPHKDSWLEALSKESKLPITEDDVIGLEQQFTAPAARRARDIRGLRQKFTALQCTFQLKIQELEKRFPLTAPHFKILRQLEPPEPSSSSASKQIRRTYFIVPPQTGAE
jgi:molecular chaperone DnaK